MTDLVPLHFSHFKTFSYECWFHWVPGPLDTDVKSWASSTCFPSAGDHRAPYFWVHSSPQVSRAPFPPPPPHFPRATPHPTRHPLVTQSRHQASPGRKIQHLSVYRQGRLLYSRFSQSLLSHLFLRVLLSWAIFSLPWWNLYSPFCLYLFHPHIPSPKDVREGNTASQKVPSSLLRQYGGVTFFFSSVMFIDATRF